MTFLNGLLAATGERSRFGDVLLTLEERNEVRTSLLRFLAVAALAVPLMLEGASEHYLSHQLTFVAYILSASISLLLSWSRFYRSWLNWLYVTIDALIVIFIAFEHIFIYDLSPSQIVIAQNAPIAFVLLALSGLRLRPGLILLFLAIVNVGSLVAIGVAWSRSAAIAGPDEFGFTIGNELFWLLVFTFTGVIQYQIVVDLRAVLAQTIVHASERENLASFFSPGVAETLAINGPEIGLSRRHAAIMFVDIRDFTALAERIEPEELAQLLSDFRARVADAVFECDGTVDKFIGDAVMAVFTAAGDATTDDARALRCALDVLARLDVWNELRQRQGLFALQAGIGLHSGLVLAGVLASGRHNEHTVIGDVVNTADRMQRMSKQVPARIVVSADLFRRVPENQRDGAWRESADQPVPGRAESLDVWILR